MTRPLVLRLKCCHSRCHLCCHSRCHLCCHSRCCVCVLTLSIIFVATVGVVCIATLGVVWVATLGVVCVLQVFCSGCCNLKIALAYLEEKEARVCSCCYQDLIRGQSPPTSLTYIYTLYCSDITNYTPPKPMCSNRV